VSALSPFGSDTVRIRPMTANDIDAVLAIERAVSPDPWTAGILADELHGPGRRYVVATRAVAGEAGRDSLYTDNRYTCDRVIGYGGIAVQVGEGHVTNIAVEPSWQGERVGARMLLDSVRHASTNGASALTLEVRVGNERAVRLYRHFGFGPVGTRPRYYPNGDDALILWAHDVDSSAYAQRLDAIATWLATPREPRRHVDEPTAPASTVTS
jgi:[ribosomal protein S18]-alanine N-acetyltransferase